MRRLALVLVGVAVLAAQIWVTLYAQLVLAYEAGAVVLALVGLGLVALVRARRQRPAAAPVRERTPV